jgi:hypothetical protein
MTDESTIARFTPSLARLILEQIESFAKEKAISLDDPAVTMAQQQMTYKHVNIPSGYGAHQTSHPTIEGSVSPLIPFLKQLKNIPLFSPNSSAFDVLKREGIIIDNLEETSRQNETVLQDLSTQYAAVCADAKVQRNIVEHPKADSRAYTLNIAKIREIAAGGHIQSTFAQRAIAGRTA